MSHKRPTADQIGNLLSQPHFRRNEAASTQPATSAPMLVDVDNIVPYDRNPRRTANATYEEIKESIRATGLDRVLIITQRPDTADSATYMIGAGGNTCLRALRELWHETGNERFRQVWCQFRPWEGETNTLLAHVRENDLRSDLTLIDRALAIQELRQLLEIQARRLLSQRELRDALKERGYQISQTMIRWYAYAVDTLYPLIPTVLHAGIGRPQIQRIYELQRAFCQTWALLGLGGEDSSDAAELFAQTLQRLDNEILDSEALRSDLENELATSADCSIQRASLELGAALTGRDAKSDSPAPETGAPQRSADTSAVPIDEAGTAQGADDKGVTDNSPHPPAPPVVDKGSEADAAEPKMPDPPAPASDPDPAPPVKSPAARTIPSTAAMAQLPNDIKSLRARCWTLATRLAQSARLGDIVIPIPAGLGFLVGPVPLGVQFEMHPEAGRTAMCVWWHLATLAEQFARHGQACEFMPEDWRDRRIGDAMRHARDSDQAFAHWQWVEADRELFNDVPGLEPNDIGPLLYQVWTDQRWADWVALVETYRTLYRQTHDNPWRDS